MIVLSISLALPAPPIVSASRGDAALVPRSPISTPPPPLGAMGRQWGRAAPLHGSALLSSLIGPAGPAGTCVACPAVSYGE